MSSGGSVAVNVGSTALVRPCWADYVKLTRPRLSVMAKVRHPGFRIRAEYLGTERGRREGYTPRRLTESDCDGLMRSGLEMHS
jgi:hypothetical protein